MAAAAALAALATGCGGGGGSTGTTSPASSGNGPSVTAMSVTGLSCTASSKGVQMYCTAVGSDLPEGMQFTATDCVSVAEAPNGNSTQRSFVCTPQRAGPSTVDIGSGGKSLWSSTVQVAEAATTLGVASAQGIDKTVVVRSDGNVWLLGRSHREGSGTGPMIVGSGYVKAAATQQDVVAIKADGSLWDLQAADGTLATLGTGFVDVRGGAGHFLALKTDGSLWAWGDNDLGQVGNGSSAMTPVSIPQAILQNVVAFDVGYSYSVAVRADGTVWAWGEFPETPSYIAVPTQIAQGYTKVFVGSAGILALRADSTLWWLGWGRNTADAQVASHVVAASGNLVLRDDRTVWQAQDPSTTPWALSPVAGLPASIITVDGDFADSGYAIDDAGQLWGWGSLADGRLGGDTPTFKTVPTLVGNVGTAPPKSLAAGNGTLLVVDSDGTAYQFGIDISHVTNPDSAVPALPFQSSGNGFVQVALGDGHAAAIKSDGSLWTWGGNWAGELGVGDTDPHAGMQNVGSGFVSVAATTNSTVAVKADGTLWAWGQTTPLVVGGPVPPTSPQQIGTGFELVAAGSSGALALKSDGSIWGWGDAPNGLFAGVAPTHIADGFVQVAAGDSGWLALKADGTAWALSSSAPATMVQIASNVKQIAANGLLVMLLSKDGTLWTWGAGDAGELGNGMTGSITIAAQRIATNIVAIAAGYDFAAAVDANGDVLAWGGWSGFSATWPGAPTTRTPSFVRF
jgi:alpha-tubulin suppressor-like RCC1 family protein